MPLLKYFSVGDVEKMEQVDFEDWLAAANASWKDEMIDFIMIAQFAQPAYTNKAVNKRNVKLKSIENEKLFLLGHNPYKADPEKIEQSRKRLWGIKLKRDNKK